MRTSCLARPILTLAVPLLLAGCLDATSATVTLPIQTAPDFTARVVIATHEQMVSPEGPVSQYDLFVAIPPSDTANAGVVIPESMPVFEAVSGQYVSTTAATIRVGQTIQVWHDFRVAYGAVQAPPGAPVYVPTQVVVIP